jgi:putative exporter of polyketide antibiotics
VGQLEPQKPERPPFPVGFVVVGVLALLGAIWLFKTITSLVFGLVPLLLIGVVVYAAVRLGMGPRERK